MFRPKTTKMKIWRLYKKPLWMGTCHIIICVNRRRSLVPTSYLNLFLMLGFKDVSMLSWNIWGALNKTAQRHLMDLIRRHSPTFLIIMETHGAFEKTISFWNKAGYNKVAIVDARGQSGGLWILKHNSSTIITSVEDIFHDTVTLKVSVGNDSWLLTGMYASPIYTKRLELWQHLISLNANFVGPWMVIGDFNEIILPNEQKGGNFSQNRADALLRVVEECQFVDIATTGNKYTWARNCMGQRRIFKKLDRGIANLPWQLAFPEAYVEVLCRLHSDHHPLLLRCGQLPQRRGPRPFRFEAAWITHPEYQNVVQTAWSQTTPCPIAGLNQVKTDSLIFNSNVFGNIRHQKHILEKRIKGIQLSLERVDSARLVYLEHDLQLQYDRILAQEELLWYQKSRDKWIKLGDRNTKFFHATTVIRRKRNKIHGLHLPCGMWCTDDNILKDEAQKFFKNLFGADPLSRNSNPTNENVTSPKLSEEAVECLSKTVTREEYWHIVGEDVYNLVCQAFASGTFNSCIGETLIALIPKVDYPQNFKEFRPISLCNTIYKLITKVLVNRLRPYLDQIIGPYQSSFLPGRGTCDNAIVLQEVIHSMKKSKKKKGDVVYKIDLEKAYDHVNWEFLRSCLIQFGFPPITITLIMHCVSASSLSLIWNGQRLPSFSPTRGLRQGDPLSPYLFVICMESLSHAILQAVDNNAWKPVSISRNGPGLSHLFFADDVLLFSKATVSQATVIEGILTKFANLSGLRVNIQKSRAFFSATTRQNKIDSIVSITGIQNTNSLEKYLGFPIIHGRLCKRDYDFFIDKIQHRLASWKNKLLNKAGRLALVQSVLTSIPTYYMQLNWLPSSICDYMDRISRKFLWRGTNDRGIHLVGWEKIAQPKKNGGLGIRSARESNTAMLGKLVWDIHSKKDKLQETLCAVAMNIDWEMVLLPSGMSTGRIMEDCVIKFCMLTFMTS
ncbi:ribonuclease H, partial [Trifolium pratense]